MRAITLASFDGIDALELSEVPDPVPGPGEELVEVRAVAVGPRDLSAGQGAFAAAGGSTDFPQAQGWDFAGTTPDGRRVIGLVLQPWMRAGAFAEKIAVASDLLADLPDGLSWSEGAALPVCSLTVPLLVDAAEVSDGHSVVVTGAAGMVGGFAVELARAKGAVVARSGARGRRGRGPWDGSGHRARHEWELRRTGTRMDAGWGGRVLGHRRSGCGRRARHPGQRTPRDHGLGSIARGTRGIRLQAVQVQPDATALESLAAPPTVGSRSGSEKPCPGRISVVATRPCATRGDAARSFSPFEPRCHPASSDR